jgi:uncharacterized membrane protein (UPF0127 family)
MRRGVWALAVLALGGCASDDTPAASSGVAGATTTISEPALTPVGFERVAATAVSADGIACELCLWLADTPERRSLGLMGVTDLGGADGMLFRYPSPTSTTFWMKDTVMPLSIAYFDRAGSYLDALDMTPCTSDPCPHYSIAPSFALAVEVAQGDLAALGLTPGSTLTVSDTACGV